MLLKAPSFPHLTFFLPQNIIFIQVLLRFISPLEEISWHTHRRSVGTIFSPFQTYTVTVSVNHLGMAFSWATMRRKVRHSEIGVHDSAPPLAINEAPRNSYIRLGVRSISF